jgi:hypothetical protein
MRQASVSALTINAQEQISRTGVEVAWGQVLPGDNMKHATKTIVGGLSSRSLIGDLLWLGTIAFVFTILTGVVH